MPGPRTKVMIPLFAIGGLVSHLAVFSALVATLGAIAGLDDGTSTASTSSVVPATTATATPAPIVVDSVVSGDSVVVSDGIHKVTVTISGIDAPDSGTAQCWSAESLAFTATALVGKRVILGVPALTADTVTTTLHLAEATADFAVAAVAAGMARAAATGATDAIRAAQAAAELAGAGLWGAPCLGGVEPAQLQPLVPMEPVLPTAETPPR